MDLLNLLDLNQSKSFKRVEKSNPNQIQAFLTVIRSNPAQIQIKSKSFLKNKNDEKSNQIQIQIQIFDTVLKLNEVK